MPDRRLPTRMTIAIVCALACLATIPLDAEDWPQWRGVDRDAVWRDTGVVERFADDGLIVKWRTPIRGGFAGPAVARRTRLRPRLPGDAGQPHHGTVTSACWSSTRRPATCSGRGEWPAAYRNIHFKFAIGPRATPTVDGDRVYILGAAGTLSCFEVETGDLLWRVDTAADYGVTVPVFRRLAVAAGGGRPPHRPARRRARRDGGGRSTK